MFKTHNDRPANDSGAQRAIVNSNPQQNKRKASSVQKRDKKRNNPMDSKLAAERQKIFARFNSDSANSSNSVLERASKKKNAFISICNAGIVKNTNESVSTPGADLAFSRLCEHLYEVRSWESLVPSEALIESWMADLSNYTSPEEQKIWYETFYKDNVKKIEPFNNLYGKCISNVKTVDGATEDVNSTFENLLSDVDTAPFKVKYNNKLVNVHKESIIKIDKNLRDFDVMDNINRFSNLAMRHFRRAFLSGVMDEVDLKYLKRIPSQHANSLYENGYRFSPKDAIFVPTEFFMKDHDGLTIPHRTRYRRINFRNTRIETASSDLSQDDDPQRCGVCMNYTYRRGGVCRSCIFKSLRYCPQCSEICAINWGKCALCDPNSTPLQVDEELSFRHFIIDIMHEQLTIDQMRRGLPGDFRDDQEIIRQVLEDEEFEYIWDPLDGSIEYYPCEMHRIFDLFELTSKYIADYGINDFYYDYFDAVVETDLYTFAHDAFKPGEYLYDLPKDLYKDTYHKILKILVACSMLAYDILMETKDTSDLLPFVNYHWATFVSDYCDVQMKQQLTRLVEKHDKETGKKNPYVYDEKEFMFLADNLLQCAGEKSLPIEKVKIEDNLVIGVDRNLVVDLKEGVKNDDIVIENEIPGKALFTDHYFFNNSDIFVESYPCPIGPLFSNGEFYVDDIVIEGYVPEDQRVVVKNDDPVANFKIDLDRVVSLAHTFLDSQLSDSYSVDGEGEFLMPKAVDVADLVESESTDSIDDEYYTSHSFSYHSGDTNINYIAPIARNKQTGKIKPSFFFVHDVQVCRFHVMAACRFGERCYCYHPRVEWLNGEKHLIMDNGAVKHFRFDKASIAKIEKEFDVSHPYKYSFLSLKAGGQIHIKETNIKVDTELDKLRRDKVRAQNRAARDEEIKKRGEKSKKQVKEKKKNSVKKGRGVMQTIKNATDRFLQTGNKNENYNGKPTSPVSDAPFEKDGAVYVEDKEEKDFGLPPEDFCDFTSFYSRNNVLSVFLNNYEVSIPAPIVSKIYINLNKWVGTVVEYNPEEYYDMFGHVDKRNINDQMFDLQVHDPKIIKFRKEYTHVGLSSVFYKDFNEDIYVSHELLAHILQPKNTWKNYSIEEITIRLRNAAASAITINLPRELMAKGVNVVEGTIDFALAILKYEYSKPSDFCRSPLNLGVKEGWHMGTRSLTQKYQSLKELIQTLPYSVTEELKQLQEDPFQDHHLHTSPGQLIRNLRSTVQTLHYSELPKECAGSFLNTMKSFYGDFKNLSKNMLEKTLSHFLPMLILP